jgi:hypothetical protein
MAHLPFTECNWTGLLSDLIRLPMHFVKSQFLKS